MAERREVLKLMGWAAGSAFVADHALAEHIHKHLAVEAQLPKQPQFFQEQVWKTVFRLTDLILPSDGTPGARDAAVTEFLDYYLANSSDAAKTSFRQGLDWLEASAQAKFGKAFVDLTADQQTALLTLISSPANRDPGDLQGKQFFNTLRQMTVFAFYTSKVGIQSLGFKGNTFAAEFPGACTHQHEL